MKKILSVFLVGFIALSSFAQQKQTDSITADGQKLIQFLDGTNVESLWARGWHVNWETGVSTTPSRNSHSTHCSAFAASVAKQMGFYLLRPPEHGQNLLANAQFDWLQTDEAAKNGWEKVATGWDAQSLANHGYLVLVVYKNNDEARPGHIAVVRPAVKTEMKITEEGTQVTQAGGHNYYSISLKTGFGNHPDAWPNGVVFYKHSVDWQAIK
ncbi:hypothetical protein [Parasediminibacterium sp. JCM 36343]|uniref:hypothetical protein n=1 Tax=Parasediminibacterium sp. JCM 36343 TaxID=3374279 RepID=UPI003979940C